MKRLHFNSKEFLTDTLVFISASAIYSVALNCFLARNNILNGGLSGIAIIFNYLFGIPIGTAIFVLNIPLLIVAGKKLGAYFLIRTFWVITISSTLIDLGAFLPVYKNDLLLSSIFGGLLSGISLGFIFLRNATTGGVDIIARLIKARYPKLTLGKSMLILDAIVIMAGGLVYGDFEPMLYAVISVFIGAQALDYTILRFQK